MFDLARGRLVQIEVLLTRSFAVLAAPFKVFIAIIEKIIQQFTIIDSFLDVDQLHCVESEIRIWKSENLFWRYFEFSELSKFHVLRDIMEQVVWLEELW